MFNTVKKVFKKNKKSVDITDQFDAEIFSDLSESERQIVLRDIIKNRKESELDSLNDDSDSLIFSISFFLSALAFLVMSNSFEIPSSLFLGTAVFALYFSIVSLFKTGNIKTMCTMLIFPLTGFISFLFIKYHNDINDINNGLSLLALSVSLIIIPFQKRIQRTRLGLNRFKDARLLHLEKETKDQKKIIKKLEEVIKQNNSIENFANNLDEVKKEIKISIGDKDVDNS